MVNIIKFETERERIRRERRENIVKDYLKYAEQILHKEVAPGRVFKYLASQYKMTEYGIGSILKRYGVYESADKPVVFPNDNGNLILPASFFA
jgi:hypothetical protein